MTLTEPLRKSYGGREDDFKSDSDDDTGAIKRRDYVETGSDREDDSNSDSDDETRAKKCGDYDETGGGREDGLNLGSDERACTYIGGMNYVAFTGGGEQT